MPRTIRNTTVLPGLWTEGAAVPLAITGGTIKVLLPMAPWRATGSWLTIQCAAELRNAELYVAHYPMIQGTQEDKLVQVGSLGMAYQRRLSAEVDITAYLTRELLLLGVRGRALTAAAASIAHVTVFVSHYQQDG